MRGDQGEGKEEGGKHTRVAQLFLLIFSQTKWRVRGNKGGRRGDRWETDTHQTIFSSTFGRTWSMKGGKPAGTCHFFFIQYSQSHMDRGWEYGKKMEGGWNLTHASHNIFWWIYVDQMCGVWESGKGREEIICTSFTCQSVYTRAICAKNEKLTKAGTNHIF